MIFAFVFRGEKIKVEAKLKLSVGDDNSADIEFNGEATEATKTFVNNGYLEALNGKIEICVDKECNQTEFEREKLNNFFKKIHDLINPTTTTTTTINPRLG